MRVVIAEDSVLLRRGAIRLLEDAGFEVVGEAGDADELLRIVRETRPDVAVVDIRMPPTHLDEGLQAARVIRAELPDVGVLMLSQYVEERYVTRAARARRRGRRLPAQGPRRRRSSASRTRSARSPRAGRCSTPRSSRTCSAARGNGGPLERLTEREREVLQLMAEGKTNRAISQQLYMSERAVERHVTAIFTKLDLPVTDQDHRRVLAVLAYVKGARLGVAPDCGRRRALGGSSHGSTGRSLSLPRRSLVSVLLAAFDSRPSSSPPALSHCADAARPRQHAVQRGDAMEVRRRHRSLCAHPSPPRSARTREKEPFGAIGFRFATSPPTRRSAASAINNQVRARRPGGVRSATGNVVARARRARGRPAVPVRWACDRVGDDRGFRVPHTSRT